MSNQSIILNLETLLAAVQAQPEEQFDLSMFRDDTSCGTLFCTAGLACTMPVFQAQGFALIGTPVEFPTRTLMVYHVEVNGEDVRDCGPSDPAFGPDSYQTLFEHAGGGMFDYELGYDDDDFDNMSDKTLACLRLKYQIELLKEKA